MRQRRPRERARCRDIGARVLRVERRDFAPRAAPGSAVSILCASLSSSTRPSKRLVVCAPRVSAEDSIRRRFASRARAAVAVGAAPNDDLSRSRDPSRSARAVASCSSRLRRSCAIARAPAAVLTPGETIDRGALRFASHVDDTGRARLSVAHPVHGVSRVESHMNGRAFWRLEHRRYRRWIERARSVLRALIARGVAADRLAADSMICSSLVCDPARARERGADRACRRQNDRFVLRF